MVKFIIGLLLFFCPACATRYFVTDPSTYIWKISKTKDSLEYFVLTDVFRKTGNKKCFSKEKKHKMACVALKIINHGDSAVTLEPESFRFQADSNDIEYIEPMEFYKNVKQIPELYLFWLLVNPIIVKQNFNYTYNPNVSPVSYKYYPIPLGLPIGIGNFILANNANTKLKKDILDKQMLGKTIGPHQTLYGYIYIKRPTKLELKLK
jgi:hypothetical protein